MLCRAPLKHSAEKQRHKAASSHVDCDHGTLSQLMMSQHEMRFAYHAAGGHMHVCHQSLRLLGRERLSPAKASNVVAELQKAVLI